MDTNEKLEELIPAEVFSPGEYIRDELEARGWTQDDLATITGRPLSAVSQIITGKRSISADWAAALADAFGTSVELWLRLEADYLAHHAQRDPKRARLASLFEYAPVKEMVRRNWISESENVEVMESQILKFFGSRSVSELPELAVAARKSTDYGKASIAEIAWFARVKQLARTVQAKKFLPSDFASKFSTLRTLCGDPENIRHVPRVLAEWGIRFVVVEGLQKTKIDGGVLWLSDAEPVVALTLRFDRIDSFWHTTIHELVHVKNGDKDIIDIDIIADSKGSIGTSEKPPLEVKTDAETVEYLVPQKELNDFITRVNPFYYKEKIKNFANKMRMHPGVVVGQLHHRRCGVHWSHNREMLLQNQIRPILSSSAVVDGWDLSLGPLVTE